MKKAHKHFSWNPIHPHRDWSRFLIILGILILVIIGVSTYLFLASEKAQQSSDQANAVDTVPEEGSTAKRLERISSFFEKRK
jgi:uncharacterized protein YpmB